MGKTMKHPYILAALLSLSACGGAGPAENTADRLEEAAEQSNPAAAEVLEDAADEIEAGNVESPDRAAQQALERAGNAQAPDAGPPPGTSQPVDSLENSY